MLSSTLKLLNIDAAREHFIKSYEGPKLPEEMKNFKIMRSKEKEEMVKSVFDSLKSLMPETHLNQKIETNMGFYIDTFCVIDKKCNPIAINKATNEHIK